MASTKPHHRRESMEEPLTMSSFIHLREELNRLHKDFSPECNKHIDTINNLLNELEVVYLPSACSSVAGARVGRYGLAILFVGLALFVFNEEVSAFVAAAGAGMAVFGAFAFAFGRNKKTQKENLKRTIKEELKGIQDKNCSIIDVMEKICQHSVEILRNAGLSEHKAQALSEHFAYRLEKRHLIQEHDSSKVGVQMSKIVHLSGNLAEMITKVSSVPEILKEIIEDNKRRHDKPAKPTHEQINKMEKFINDIQKGISGLKNNVKEIGQIAEKITNL
ncbi:uncharacterized protein LOC125247668 [Megalobrama amblycephala]|uniref:uncharacterized protein LOC125247668 n=1 Tax=Megalobrama amblycephala TaxID=75352 RepID=UPI0020145CCC|nr:uncharacterized protein LOC125247668 [Megalobrama amblycephala]